MTRPDAVVDFFIIEANEYVDRLDQLLGPAGSSGPDPELLARQARALRGSATMYRQAAISRLAGGIENVGRALRERTIRWDASLRGTLVAAIDDLRVLIRGVRSWGPAEERRAVTRSQELEKIAPPRATPSATAAGDGGSAFVAATAARLATALERVVAAPTDRARLEVAVQEVRAARGLAYLRDAAPLPEVCDAVERAVDVLDGGGGTTTAMQLALLDAAAAVLRRAAADLSAGRKPSSSSDEVQHFAAAASALAEDGGAAQPAPVIPISELFFQSEPGIVRATPNPPSTPQVRLRLELVSRAEHLRRLTAEARLAADPIAMGRVRRDLRSALRAIHDSAQSFGEEGIARALGRWEEVVASLDADSLARVDELAVILARADERLEGLQQQLERVPAPSPAATQKSPAPAGAPAPARQTAAGLSAPARSDDPPAAVRRPPTPTGSALHALLEAGIERLGKLRDRPLTPPVPLHTDEIVPIESLLYRGQSALRRAHEIRDVIRSTGQPVSQEMMDELVDLVELAAAE